MMNFHFGTIMFTTFNYLLLLGSLALFVLLAAVLLKLNRALNIWLARNSE